MEPQLELIEQSFDANFLDGVSEALDELPHNFTITDPCISGHPIVFASRGFVEMLGYSKEEVIGKNGRMFQGKGTCRRSVMEIREAVREERELQLSLLNYRKDGIPFWMLLHMIPVFSVEEGRVIHFVAVQVPIVRRPKQSRNGHAGCGFCCENGLKSFEILHRSCRREVCSETTFELSRGLAFDCVSETDKGIEVDELCEAGELEKQQATSAINNILSVLIQYSKLRGISVSARRCNLEGRGFLNSALLTSLGRIKQSFVLIDPHLPSMPIVYASDAFLKLTGYARHEVVGQRYRFRSCSETDSSTLLQINASVQSGKSCTIRILDYRKDQSSFWNRLHISPVRNASGKIAYIVEVHTEEDGASRDGQSLNPELRPLGAIAAVKVAVRSASMGPGCSSR